MAERLRVRCPYCHGVVEVAGVPAGAKADCPACGKTFKAPQRPGPSAPAAPVPGPPAPTQPPDAIPPVSQRPAPPAEPQPAGQQLIACPGCGQQMTVSPDLFGAVLACPTCGCQFTPGPAPMPSVPAVSIQPGQPFAWASPVHHPPAGVSAPEPVSQRMVDAATATRPWAMLLAILWFCGGIGNVVLLLIAVVPGLRLAPHGGPAWAAMLLALLAGVAASLLLAILLMGYALACGRFAQTGRARELEAVLIAQKRFWQAWGVAAIASFVLGIIVAAILFG